MQLRGLVVNVAVLMHESGLAELCSVANAVELQRLQLEWAQRQF